jgi:hypothetical protein
MEKNDKDWQRRFDSIKPHPVLLHRNCIAFVHLFRPDTHYSGGLIDLWWSNLLENIEDIGLPDEVVERADPFYRFDEAMKAQSKEFLEQFLPYTCVRFLTELKNHIEKEITDREFGQEELWYEQLELPFEEFKNEQRSAEADAPCRPGNQAENSNADCTSSESKN